MMKRLMTLTNVLAVATVFLLAAVNPQVAGAASHSLQTAQSAERQTEDVIFLEDGRILRGKVLSENELEVVFEVIDRSLNITTRMTFQRAIVERIDRDVPIRDADGQRTTGPVPPPADKPTEDPWAATFGTRQGASDDPNLPSFYFVPMHGQMGTDISEDVYREMYDDIVRAQPDFVVIVMNTGEKEEEKLMPEHPLELQGGERNFDSIDFLDMYRGMVRFFRDDLRAALPNTRQILWIEDSTGIGSIVALAWEDVYMKPEARLGGAAKFQAMWAGLGENVDGKYREAMMALLFGFAEYGGYQRALVEAMVRSERVLSATWRGREVEWRLDRSGEYLVDGSDKITANFTAKTAEDFLISKGTAETLDDLALLLGVREYRVIDGNGMPVYERYVQNWRRQYLNCREWMLEAIKFQRWARGEDELRYLGRYKSMLENILGAITRHKAVEMRMAADYGVTRLGLIITIEVIEERIRALRQRDRGAGRAGGGGGIGGAGGPGGR